METIPSSRRPSGLTIVSNNEQDDEAFQSSMEITCGGSIYYKGYKIGRQGVIQAPHNESGKVSEINDLSELRFLEELGRGASSTVWRAELYNNGRKNVVAVKELQLKREMLHQFGKELDSLLLPRLKENRSPHVVSIYDAFFDRDGDKLYIVLEFCNGGTLDACIKRSGKADEQVVSVVMRQLFRGLAFLFDLGIQHRDMKPANILLTTAGGVKITDFGSSKGDALSETFVGTTRYMSPERLNGSVYTWAADVWSSGIIMLEIAMGDHPYRLLYGDDSSFPALIEYTTRRDTPQLPAPFSVDAQDFVALCLAKDPAQRLPPSTLVPLAEEELEDSHPFIATHSAVPYAVVSRWMGLS